LYVVKNSSNRISVGTEFSKNKCFEELLLSSIDETFSLLGDLCKKALYFHLEKKFHFTKKDIPYKIDEFTNAIENVFGVSAKIIKIQILKNLHKKVPYFRYFPKRDLLFNEYLRAVRQAF
jgi:hypothetical protein